MFQSVSASFIQDSIFIGNLHVYFWMKRKNLEACDWLRGRHVSTERWRCLSSANDVLHRLVDAVVENVVKTLPSGGYVMY